MIYLINIYSACTSAPVRRMIKAKSIDIFVELSYSAKRHLVVRFWDTFCMGVRQPSSQTGMTNHKIVIVDNENKRPAQDYT